jgi:hypothetical protein
LHRLACESLGVVRNRDGNIRRIDAIKLADRS